MNKTWADILLESMISNNISRIYWYPWGANLPLYDKLSKCKEIEHILVRHEQAAAFAAQWQSRTSDKIWVCLVTSGPGTANALTWVYDAYMDNIPMIFLTAQVPHTFMWNDVFQEMDTIWATMSFTKHSFLIDDVNTIPEILNASIEIATTWRPGPVLIDLPKNIQTDLYTWENIIKWYTKQEEKNFLIKDSVIKKILSEINNAKKPILIVGHWIKISKAENELNEFVSKLWIPTVTTLHWKWIINEKNKNYLWMMWMHWFYHANLAIHNADLIINIWSRFDDRIVGTYESFWKKAKIIHVDIDKSELNKLVKTDIAILSDAKYFLNKILENKLNKLKITDWKNKIQKWKESHPYEEKTSYFWVKNALNIINNNTKKSDNFVFVTDVWQHQMWSAQIIKVSKSKYWLTSGWAWTMWFWLPTSVWAAFTNPEKTIIVIAWDWWIQMNIQELQLLKHHNLNIKVIIMNNSFLWMVRQLQDHLYNKNYASTPLSSPNFKKVAEAYGINGYSVNNSIKFNKILSLELNKKWPAVIEVKLEKDIDNVFPIVEPWKSLKNTIIK